MELGKLVGLSSELEIQRRQVQKCARQIEIKISIAYLAKIFDADDFTKYLLIKNERRDKETS